MEEKMLTIAQLAERFGIDRSTIVNWIRLGEFPNAYKLNPRGLTSRWQIPESDIEAFVMRQKNQLQLEK